MYSQDDATHSGDNEMNRDLKTAYREHVKTLGGMDGIAREIAYLLSQKRWCAPTEMDVGDSDDSVEELDF
jgi:hypothetical protein